jgi:hypothetical protein
VWLHLLNHHTQSLAPGGRGKLSPKYVGPYKVLERVGKVAYRLQLPKGARIHDVFHVGVLKPMRGPPPSMVLALPPLRHGRPLLQPDRVLCASLRQGVWHVLVQWADMPPSEATWEQVDEFCASHPSFQLEDELFSEGGDVMVGRTYQRKRRPVAKRGQASAAERAVRCHHTAQEAGVSVTSQHA